MKKILTAFVFALLLYLLFSCSVSQRANRRLIKANKHILKAESLGATWSADTVFKTVSVVVPLVKTDTLFQAVPGDTVRVEKDKLKIKYVRLPGDSVFIEGECESDTIYKEVPVVVNKEIKTENFFWRNVSLFLLIVGLAWLLWQRINNNK